ncbi:MAG: hypothetical protein C0424_06930 [Sphingobacteriaceae bacterium]|nr:hypothetical protein [Sphingobacteriaceae bacterium]
MNQKPVTGVGLDMENGKNSLSEIIYLFDPLCGWCYGFGPQMQLFAAQFPNVSYTVLSGGMVTGERVGPLANMASYIREGVARVEALSGVKFGPDFLNDLHGEGKMQLDSTPPSKAFVILKEHSPASAIELAHAIQSVYYSQGLDPNLASSYHALALSYGLSIADFDEKFESMEYQLATRDEFSQVARFGVSGYPTVVARFGNQYYMLGHGFTKAEQLGQTLQNILQKEGLTL